MEINSTQPPIEEIEKTPELTPEITQEIVKTELMALPEADRKEVGAIIKDSVLIKIDAHKKRVTYFKRRYSPSKIPAFDINDKDGLDTIVEALRDMRTERVTTEKEKKEGTKPMRDGIAFLNGKFEPVVEDIEKIEAPWQEAKKNWVAGVEKAKKAEAEAIEIRTNERVDKLIAAKCSFDGNFYSIGSEEFNVPFITLGMVDIQTPTDAIFDNILDQIYEKATIIAAATEKKREEQRIADQERIAAELEEKRKFEKEQEDLRLEKEKHQKEQEAFQRAQEQFKQQQEEFENQRKEAERKEKIAKDQADEKLWRSRLAEMNGIGWNGQYAFNPDWDDEPIISHSQLISFDDAKFNLLRDEWNSTYAKQEEEKRVEKEKEDKIKQEQAEETKKQEEARIAAKAIADQKAREEQEEYDRKLALAKKGDNAVWNDFISRLKAIEFPKATTTEYMSKIEEVQKFIDNLK